MKALKRLGVIVVSLALTVSLMPVTGMMSLADEAETEAPAATAEAEDEKPKETAKKHKEKEKAKPKETEKPAETEAPKEPAKTEAEAPKETEKPAEPAKTEPSKEETEKPKETEATEATEAKEEPAETKEQEESKATEAPAETGKDADQPKETEGTEAPAETGKGDAEEPKESEKETEVPEESKPETAEDKLPEDKVNQPAKGFSYTNLDGDNLTWGSHPGADYYVVYATDIEHPINDIDEDSFIAAEFDADDEREINVARLIDRGIKQGDIVKSKSNKYRIYLIAYEEYNSELDYAVWTFNYKTNAKKITVGRINATISGGKMSWKAISGTNHYEVEITDGGMYRDPVNYYEYGTSCDLNTKIDNLIKTNKIFKYRFYRVCISSYDDDGVKTAYAIKNYTYESSATPNALPKTISCALVLNTLSFTRESWAHGYELRIIADNGNYIFWRGLYSWVNTIDLQKAVKEMVEDYDFDETCTYKFELYAYDKNYNYLAVARSNTWGYKSANSLNVSGKTAKVKRKKVKKKKQTLAVNKVLNISDAGQGTLSYKKLSGNKKITINATTGKVTVKKKTKKGTYKVTVLVKSSGDDTHIRTQKKVVFKIKVK